METILGVLIVSFFIGFTSFSIARTNQLKNESIKMLNMNNICYNIIQIIKSDSYFYSKVNYYLNNSEESEGIVFVDTTDTVKTITIYYDEYGNITNSSNFAFLIDVSCSISSNIFKTDYTYQISKELHIQGNSTTKGGNGYRIKKVEKA